jgi:hypothetical protein
MDPMTALPTTWDREGLEAAGFEGFVPFTQLRVTKPPKLPGIYVVVRPSIAPRSFLASSVAGWFKGNDPTAEQSVLDKAWVNGTTILYIGKANWGKNEDGLRRRLSEYRRFGAGKAVGHRGGEHIWQLADHAELLVCWKVTDDAEVTGFESRLIDDFEERHERWPFANRKPEPRR